MMNILCGTTVSGGHGAQATGSEAVLCILDWESKEIIYQTVPVPGSRSLPGLHVDEDGLVHGLASPSITL